MEFDEEDSGPPPRAPEKPFSLLKRAFLNEICAPELLPYQDSTVDTLVSLVQKQVRIFMFWISYSFHVWSASIFLAFVSQSIGLFLKFMFN
jgi:hypothetical protein